MVTPNAMKDTYVQERWPLFIHTHIFSIMTIYNFIVQYSTVQ